jgi:hypothetical protein
LPGKGLNDHAHGIEIYDQGRFLTVPGRHLPGTPTTVENRSAVVVDIYRELTNPLAKLVVSAADVASREPRPVDWLTDRFIERGELVLVTAPPGAMKSLLFLTWAASVAAGRNWLGRPNGSGGLASQRAGVLWLNTDNGQQTHEDRLGAILRALKALDPPLYSVTTTDFALSNPETLRTWTNSRTPATLALSSLTR